MRFRDQNQQSGVVEVNLTPLIDVVFLLLIFFMVSTSFQKDTKLEIALPESTSDASLQEETNTLRIEINAEGKYALQGPGQSKARELVSDDNDTLASAIRDLSQDKTDLDVVIQADRAAPYQSVVRAMDECRNAGLVHFNLATEAPAGR